MANAQSNFYKDYMEQLQLKAKAAVKKAQEKTFEEYFEVADKKIRGIYKNTITDFYKDYYPHFYDRRGSLYDLIQTKYGTDYLSISFDPSKISYRNGYSGEDGLYNTVFRQGWHGGAMIRGSMLYPVGKYENGKPRAYDGTYKPYEDENYKYNWIVANRASISPLNDFRNRIDEYQKNEYQKDYEKIWNRNKQNIRIEM